MSAPAIGRHMPDRTKQGVNPKTSNDNAQVAFLGSSCVTRTSTLEETFLVDKNLVPIKIEKMPSIYTLFILLFTI